MLPKKGSRRATIDGVVYRWRQSHGHHTFELRLERFDDPGQLLCVRFPYRHLDTARPHRVYRPILVNRLLRGCVVLALDTGWEPNGRGVFEIGASVAAGLVSDSDYRWSRDLVYTRGQYR